MGYNHGDCELRPVDLYQPAIRLTEQYVASNNRIGLAKQIQGPPRCKPLLVTDDDPPWHLQVQPINDDPNHLGSIGYGTLRLLGLLEHLDHTLKEEEEEEEEDYWYFTGPTLEVLDQDNFGLRLIRGRSPVIGENSE